MIEGWVKIYRQLLESPVFDNEKLLKVWIWCLLKATHKGYKQFVGSQLVHVNAGEFITGRKRASEELKLKEGSVYGYLKALEKEKMLKINSNNKFSIISIENWEKYQLFTNEVQQQDFNTSTTNILGQNNNKKNSQTFETQGVQRNGFSNFNNKTANSNFNNKITNRNIDNTITKDFTRQNFNNKFNNKSTTNQHKQEYNYYILYFINKYKGQNLTNLYKKMKFLREIQKDEKYKSLSDKEIEEIRLKILGGT